MLLGSTSIILGITLFRSTLKKFYRKGLVIMNAFMNASSSIERIYSLPSQESPSLCLGQEEIDTALWNVLKPLETTITFLNTGAHPDDERSHLLAYLSRGLGIKTASLNANRGEGGQNQIGDESGDALGIVRTREMQEAAKILGIEAAHLSKTVADSIYDFGIEKTAEATLEKWGEEETYRRLIHFIRAYQPDIVMPAFLDIDSEHGHHRAIAILTEKAFKDAADPTVFPEQLKQVNTWQIKKLYLPTKFETPTSASIEIGAYSPIYGMTYPQLGEKSRSFHKTQGMGVQLQSEPRQYHLELSKSIVGKDTGLFSGIAYDFYDWAQILPKQHHLTIPFRQLQQALDGLVLAYPNRQVVFEQSLTTLELIRDLLRKTEIASLEVGMKFDLLHKLKIKEQQLIEASFIASNLKFEAKSKVDIVTKGQQFEVTVQITNDSTENFSTIHAGLLVPASWKVHTKPKLVSLEPGNAVDLTFTVEVSTDAKHYHAYDNAPIQAAIQIDKDGVTIEQVQDVEVAVLPDIGLTFIPDHIVVNKTDIPEQVSLTVQVKSYCEDEVETDISLQMPAGWDVFPKNVNVKLAHQLDVVDVAFTLFPSKDIEEGQVFIQALANMNGEIINTSVENIEYDHIGTTYHLHPAELNTIVFELLKPKKLKVGYVESGFDKVADALVNVDFDITKLSTSDLASGDLSVYDTIVIGIRAYLSRPDLVKHNDRLLKYVENGGNLVVQYHRPGDGWNGEMRAPFKLELGNPSIRWRVTDAHAKVTVNKPDSTLFSYPNQITNRDWDGWVQERGLYFPSSWDEQFETFVSMADPDEDAFDGGILIAEHGKGTYIYTNLVFYRQIQNEVPGGYRIFTNLLSYGREGK